jgi:hypothetical protein
MGTCLYLGPDLTALVVGLVSLVVGGGIWQTADAKDPHALLERARQGRRLYRMVSIVILGTALTDLAWLVALFGTRAVTVVMRHPDDLVATLVVWLVLALLHRPMVAQ